MSSEEVLLVGAGVELLKAKLAQNVQAITNG